MLTKTSDPLQYLIDAVSGPVKINIPAIAAGHFPKDNTKTAVYFKGKSSVVFAFQLQKKLTAIKIWTAPAGESLRKHYHIIEDCLQHVQLDYFAGMSYLENAITIKDQQHDVLLMDWIGRQNVKEYIIANIDQKEVLDALAEKILCLHRDLNNAGIAHGHLHTGNIYIDANNELKLIDYDSIYIKGLTEEQEVLQNYPDYSHPYFSTHQKINAGADYFSALLLYLGTKAIAYNTILWGRYKVGFQENFLFTAADFLDLKNSSVYKYLRKTGSAEIAELLEILLLYCEEKDPDNLQPFYTYLKNDLQPVVNSVIVIENTIESNNRAESENPVKTKALVHVTMPAQVAIAESEETQPVIAEWPVEEKAPAENIFVPDFIHESLPATEPVLIAGNNNQKQEEVKNTSVHVADLPVKSIEKKLATTKERPGSNNATRHRVAKKHKSFFVIAVFFITVFIFTTIYFLGNYADDSSKATTPPQAKIETQQQDSPIKKAATETSLDTSTNASTIDSAATNAHAAAVPGNTIPENDSANTKPAAGTVAPLAKTSVTDSNQPATDTSINIPGKQSPGNDSMIPNEQEFKNTGHKPVVVKSDVAKKQQSNSFEIGSVPKQ